MTTSLTERASPMRMRGAHSRQRPSPSTVTGSWSGQGLRLRHLAAV